MSRIKVLARWILLWGFFSWLVGAASSLCAHRIIFSYDPIRLRYGTLHIPNLGILFQPYTEWHIYTVSQLYWMAQILSGTTLSGTWSRKGPCSKSRPGDSQGSCWVIWFCRLSGVGGVHSGQGCGVYDKLSMRIKTHTPGILGWGRAIYHRQLCVIWETVCGLYWVLVEMDHLTKRYQMTL